MFPTHPVSAAALACALSFLASLALAGCGPQARPRGPHASELRDITEGRAAEIIARVAGETGASLEAEWAVDVGAEEDLVVDFKVGSRAFGIEWVSAQDRASHGDVLPQPDPNGQLKILPGHGDDAAAQILVLEFASYRYDPDIDRVQAGSTSAGDAEGRLARDVRDFLRYVDDQGGL